MSVHRTMTKLLVFCLMFGSAAAFWYLLQQSPPESTYSGPDSTWYAEAARRIDSLRKGWITIEVRDMQGRPLTGASVRLQMQRHAFIFGSAVSAQLLTGTDSTSARYRERVRQLFNRVTLENDLKWGPWLVETPRYNRAQTFRALDWLRAQHIPVRGHALVWGYVRENDPVRYHPAQPERYRTALRMHLQEKMTAVGDRVVEWDAINHIAAGGSRRLDQLYSPSFWLELLRLADSLRVPGQRLFVNEGRILITDRRNRRAAYYEVLRYLTEHEAPFDGIGMMGHFTPQTLTAPRRLWAILDSFAVFNRPILITEFDVRFGRQGEHYRLSPQEEALQAAYTRDFLTAMFSHPAVEGIILWGFWEGRHWYPSAALYRQDWSIKPNGRVWENLVFRQWWTDTTATTDARGRVLLRGFKGAYQLTVTYGALRHQESFSLTDSAVTRRVVFDASR